MKSPIYLYWRNPLDCLESILSHPLFANQLEFVPRHIYTTVAKDRHVYTNWITGEDAWKMQVRTRYYSSLERELTIDSRLSPMVRLCWVQFSPWIKRI